MLFIFLKKKIKLGSKFWYCRHPGGLWTGNKIRNLVCFTCPEFTWMPAAPEPGGLFEKFHNIWILYHKSKL